VTKAYILKSDFLPPIRYGFGMYLWGKKWGVLYVNSAFWGHFFIEICVGVMKKLRLVLEK
jgi:hypothetical protein